MTMPPVPNRLLSPIQEDSLPCIVAPGPSSSHFVPRRNAPGGVRGYSNIRKPLNVNVGKEVSSREHNIDMYLPSDLVSQVIQVSEENTKKGLELGGILAGELCESHFEVTHLLIPEQKTAPDSK